MALLGIMTPLNDQVNSGTVGKPGVVSILNENEFPSTSDTEIDCWTRTGRARKKFLNSIIQWLLTD